MTDDESDRFLRNTGRDNDPPTTVTGAVVTIMFILGILAMLIGLISFMPVVYTYSFSLGLAYTGAIMVLLATLINKL